MTGKRGSELPLSRTYHITRDNDFWFFLDQSRTTTLRAATDPLNPEFTQACLA